MSSSDQVLEMFKNVAARIDRREFQNVSNASVITELGIDSLSMMQIVGEMETELGIMIPDEDLVELVTVGDLCGQVSKRLEHHA